MADAADLHGLHDLVAVHLQVLFALERLFDRDFDDAAFLGGNDAVAAAFGKCTDGVIAHTGGGFTVSCVGCAAALDMAKHGDAGLHADGIVDLFADVHGTAGPFCHDDHEVGIASEPGFLALYVGIAVGATAVLVPEHPVDFQKDVVERIQDSRLAGNTHFMIVVAEGVGSAVDIGKQIREAIGIEPRVTVLGHIQRGGSPTARDRETATRMGYYAVKSFAEGEGNVIVGTQEGSMVKLPIEEALQMKKHLQMDRYEIMQAMQLGRVD